MNEQTKRVETVTLSEKDALGQGDILRLIGNETPPRLGVIINADCDLAWGRTDGVISYLPIYSMKEYLAEFWMMDFLSGQKKQFVSDILSICSFPSTDSEALLRWLHDDDKSDVVTNLSVAGELNRKAKARLEEKVGDYLHIFGSTDEPDEQFKRLCSRQRNPEQFAQKQIQAAYKSMGDGHLVINELYGEREMGFVVRMLRIYSIDEKLCFNSERRYHTGNSQPDVAAIRLCRLSGVFQFKLAQQFAYQFSRVGLPDEFREMHSLVLNDIAAGFSEETA